VKVHTRTFYRVPFATPPFEKTLVWVKWNTPTAPTTTISANTTYGRLCDNSIVCSIGTLEEITPPDPTVYDEPPRKSWYVPSLSTSFAGITSVSQLSEAL